MTQPGPRFPVPSSPPPVGDPVRFKDFTIDDEPIRFRIGDQNFTAHPTLSVGLLQSISKIASEFGGDVNVNTLGEKMNSLVEMCDVILEEDSAKRFRELAPRLDLQRQIIPLLFWLLEAYGLRPTQPSSASSTSSPSETGGITSTAGASSEASDSPN